MRCVQLCIPSVPYALSIQFIKQCVLNLVSCRMHKIARSQFVSTAFFPCLPSLSLSSSKEYCFVHSMYCVRSYMQSKQANGMPQTKYYEHINSGIMYVHSIPMHSLILLFLARCSSSVIVVVVFAIVCENTELISTPDQQPHFRIGEHARRSCNVRSHAHSSASD